MSYYSENDKYYMDFKDEDGNKVTFEVIAEIFIDEKEEEIEALLESDEDTCLLGRYNLDDLIGLNSFELYFYLYVIRLLAIHLLKNNTPLLGIALLFARIKARQAVLLFHRLTYL